MMPVSNLVENKESILTSFSNTQLATVKCARTKENLLLELIVCAFFYGATKKLDKQSGICVQESRIALIGLVTATCSLPESSAISVLDSIADMAKQYGLIENIVQQGEDAAERWLACETSGDGVLHSLVEQYQGRALHEYGIGVLSTRNEAQQRLLFLSLDESISRLYSRTKTLVYLALMLSTGGLFGLYVQFYL